MAICVFIRKITVMGKICTRPEGVGFFASFLIGHTAEFAFENKFDIMESNFSLFLIMF